ncbi:MAG TPA: glycosyltransferase family 1 protein [Patescibacteria group bacterium]|jgi:glycosyltransferase involved in cell wall biosynthesis|nr:glycosyltransferase family 1 protein [Patescibacteria group bacterium]
MKIAIDISPFQTGHRVRGVGFYLENLRNTLLKYFPDNNYVFFQRGEKLPKDVQIVHFPYFEPFFLALPIYRKFKTVVTVHDLTPIVFPEAFPRGIKGEIKWQMQRFALKRADAILTDSKFSKKDIQKYVGVRENKIHVVYLAAGEQFKQLKTGNWVSEVKKRYDLPDRFLLYVGDVTWNKNLPRLIDAVKKVKIPLVMVGKSLVSEDYDKNNPWNADLNRVNELASGDKNIIRLGFVSQEELVQLYNLATVFVMSSLYEGFGLPILEAMACGCPVITSKEGSIPEVAGNSAFYVDAYDMGSVASGIRKVFDDQKLQEELSKKGLERVKSFSWKEVARETLSVYESII